MTIPTKKAVVLLSGGIDSSTILAVAKHQGYECYALSFAYGQKHISEIRAAADVAQHLQAVQHKIVSLEVGQFGHSSLTDNQLTVPDFAERTSAPNTYVPARNTMFLSVALGWAEVLDAYDIFFGATMVDYSGYPDCRQHYIEAFERMANLATKASTEGPQRFRIHAPLLYLTKAETVRLGTQLGVDYGKTISCYRADEKGRACGRCDSCHHRKQGFIMANLKDPTPYQ